MKQKEDTISSGLGAVPENPLKIVKIGIDEEIEYEPFFNTLYEKKIEVSSKSEDTYKKFLIKSNKFLNSVVSLRGILIGLSHKNIEFKLKKYGERDIVFPSKIQKLYDITFLQLKDLLFFVFMEGLEKELTEFFKSNPKIFRKIPSENELNNIENYRNLTILLESYKIKTSKKSSDLLENHYINNIHFSDGVPFYLLGLGLAYKIYVQVTLTYTNIISDDRSTKEINSVWDKLLSTSNLTYPFLGKKIKALISKRVKDFDLIQIVILLISRETNMGKLSKGSEWIYVRDLSETFFQKFILDKELYTRMIKIMNSPKYKDLPLYIKA